MTECEKCGREFEESGLRVHLARAHGVKGAGRSTCTVPECVRQARRGGLCPAHKWRLDNWGTTAPDKPVAAPGTPHGGYRPTDPISYLSAHSRVRQDRGLPSRYSCVECGDQARQWALDHDTAPELLQHGTTKVQGVERQVTWSGDPCAYRPMCIPCHGAYDAAHRASEKAKA